MIELRLENYTILSTAHHIVHHYRLSTLIVCKVLDYSVLTLYTLECILSQVITISAVADFPT